MLDEKISNTRKNLKPYIDNACNQFSRSFRHLEPKDLYQECMVKLIELSSELKELEQSEFESVYKTSIYNHLTNIYRAERRKENNIPRHTNITYLKEDDIFIEEINNRLSSTQKKILILILSPDEELIDIVYKYFYKQNKKKNTGKLAMNVNQVRLKNIHIAERLNLSSVSISKHMKKIKKESLEILL